jgi:hypothetical protein
MSQVATLKVNCMFGSKGKCGYRANSSRFVGRHDMCLDTGVKLIHSFLYLHDVFIKPTTKLQINVQR